MGVIGGLKESIAKLASQEAVELICELTSQLAPLKDQVTVSEPSWSVGRTQLTGLLSEF